MTPAAVDAAQPRSHMDEKGDTVVDKHEQPAYYALIPFAVGGDVVTAPLQLFVLFMFWVEDIKC